MFVHWHNFERLLFSVCYCSLQSGCFLVERAKHEDKKSWNVSFRTGRKWIAARYLNTAFSTTLPVNLFVSPFSLLVCYFVTRTFTCTGTHYTCSEVKSPLEHGTCTIRFFLWVCSFPFIFSCFTSKSQDIAKAKVSIPSFHISICL